MLSIEQAVKQMARRVKGKGVKPYHVFNSGYWLECEQCGRRWTWNLRAGGRNPKGFWKCPQGCNTDA